LRLSDDAHDAVAGADVVYTDAWVSMGAEAETEQRRVDLAAFQVNAELVRAAKPHAVVLHCLPAHRGDEITDDVLDGAQSRVWREVYHRRSAMVGVLRWIKGES
jgi:ornithine carbamoyltransferase